MGPRRPAKANHLGSGRRDSDQYTAAVFAERTRRRHIVPVLCPASSRVTRKQEVGFSGLSERHPNDEMWIDPR